MKLKIKSGDTVQVTAGDHRGEEGKIIKIFPMAITGKSGDRVLYASGFGGSRLLPDTDDEHGDDKKVKVSTLSLVDFFKKNGFEADRLREAM